MSCGFKLLCLHGVQPTPLIVNRVVKRKFLSCLTHPHFPTAFDGPRRFAVARPTDSQTITKLFTKSMASCRIAWAFSVDLSVGLRKSIWTDSTNKFTCTPTGHPRSLTEIVHCATGLFEGAILTVTSKSTSSIAPSKQLLPKQASLGKLVLRRNPN